MILPCVVAIQDIIYKLELVHCSARKHSDSIINICRHGHDKIKSSQVKRYAGSLQVTLQLRHQNQFRAITRDQKAQNNSSKNRPILCTVLGDGQFRCVCNHGSFRLDNHQQEESGQSLLNLFKSSQTNKSVKTTVQLEAVLSRLQMSTIDDIVKLCQYFGANWFNKLAKEIFR